MAAEAVEDKGAKEFVETEETADFPEECPSFITLPILQPCSQAQEPIDHGPFRQCLFES